MVFAMANMTDMGIYPDDTGVQISSISGHTSQAVLYVVTVIFTVAACLAILARLCARIFVAKKTGSDDAFIFIAGILSIAFCITTYKQTEFGMVCGMAVSIHGQLARVSDFNQNRASISGNSHEKSTRPSPCGSGRLFGYTTPPLASQSSPSSCNIYASSLRSTSVGLATA